MNSSNLMLIFLPNKDIRILNPGLWTLGCYDKNFSNKQNLQTSSYEGR